MQNVQNCWPYISEPESLERTEEQQEELEEQLEEHKQFGAINVKRPNRWQHMATLADRRRSRRRRRRRKRSGSSHIRS